MDNGNESDQENKPLTDASQFTSAAANSNSQNPNLSWASDKNSSYTIEKFEKWFISLFETLLKTPYQMDLFKAAFGVSPTICAKIWSLVGHPQKTNRLSFRRNHLLWALYHLKNYTPRDHEVFKVCGRTFRIWSWKAIGAMFDALDEVK